ncbi:MAG: hypothetical protein Q9187_001176, partial [Circinaria calcarea]
YDGTSHTAWLPEIGRPLSIGRTNSSAFIGSDWLSSHNFTYPIKYACRELHTQIAPGSSRASLTKLDSPLFGDFKTIGSSTAHSEGAVQCLEPILLNVPAFARGPVNASNLMFGIQTTVKRLDESVPQLMRWLPHTGARLFVILVESEDVAANMDQVLALEARMRHLGLNATLLPAKVGDNFPQRYFSLISLLYNKRGPETQWVSLIDDDTFFPSMPALLSMLSKHDSNDPYYIGSLSEDWWAVSHYGYMGFGGAGLFLSVRLAEALEPHAEECKNNPRTSAGDITVMDCIYTFTNTKLTHVVDLHQADMYGDLSGFYESGRLHLSLHHWKQGGASGEGYPMDLMHQVADVCGECFLQRWQFAGDMVLANGFSIAAYPKGHLKSDHAHSLDMSRMEETWHREMNVIHSLGPARERLALDEEKVQYTLLDSASSGGGVKQLYFHKGVSEGLDTVLELFWKDQANTSYQSA